MSYFEFSLEIWCQVLFLPAPDVKLHNWVFRNAYSQAWALRMLDGIFKDLNDRWLNLSGSKSTQRCVSFSWKFRRKIELTFCPKFSAQFQYMYLNVKTKQWQVCFKIWSPLHVFRKLKAATILLTPRWTRLKYFIRKLLMGMIL